MQFDVIRIEFGQTSFAVAPNTKLAEPIVLSTFDIGPTVTVSDGSRRLKWVPRRTGFKLLWLLNQIRVSPADYNFDALDDPGPRVVLQFFATTAGYDERIEVSQPGCRLMATLARLASGRLMGLAAHELLLWLRRTERHGLNGFIDLPPCRNPALEVAGNGFSVIDAGCVRRFRFVEGATAEVTNDEVVLAHGGISASRLEFSTPGVPTLTVFDDVVGYNELIQTLASHGVLSRTTFAARDVR